MVSCFDRNNPATLRISVTDRCQLGCIYCMPENRKTELCTTSQMTFKEIVYFARFLRQHFGLDKVRITGWEPLIRKDITVLVTMLSGVGIEDIALTTNGQLLYDMAESLAQAGLKRVNISLDSLNPDTFRLITRGGDLHRTLKGIDRAVECGLNPVKLNTVVLKDKNEWEATDIADYGLERTCRVRFLELMPMGVSAEYYNDWFVPSSSVKKILSKKYEFTGISTESGSSSRNYTVRDKNGKSGIIGFISPYTEPFCNGCRRLRVTAGGMLYGCLAGETKIDLSKIIRNKKADHIHELANAVESALSLKLQSHHFNSNRVMAAIGG